MNSLTIDVPPLTRQNKDEEAEADVAPRLLQLSDFLIFLLFFNSCTNSEGDFVFVFFF